MFSHVTGEKHLGLWLTLPGARPSVAHMPLAHVAECLTGSGFLLPHELGSLRGATRELLGQLAERVPRGTSREREPFGRSRALCSSEAGSRARSCCTQPSPTCAGSKRR